MVVLANTLQHDLQLPKILTPIYLHAQMFLLEKLAFNKKARGRK